MYSENLKRKITPLLTNYLYVWTFAFCLFQYKRKRKNWKDVCMILDTCKSHHNLSHFLSCCYSCHPCFLLYYSISEWCQVLYMVWMYVQGGDVKVTTGRCFIFVMKYIMLTYIQAGIMFNYFVVECLYLIHWKRGRNVDRKWNRLRRGCPLLVHLCAWVHQSCGKWGQSGSNMATS